jgi:hypothetical protein
MNSIVGTFPEVEAAYRSERISSTFRTHAATRHRYLFRWHRHSVSQIVPRQALRAA